MQELLAAEAGAQRSQVRKTQAPAILETKTLRRTQNQTVLPTDHMRQRKLYTPARTYLHAVYPREVKTIQPRHMEVSKAPCEAPAYLQNYTWELFRLPVPTMAMM